ncbi:peptidase C60 sortase A and B [Kribbella flavida DSM 17836]|uniref:Peptidase C60 sortase A and B n=1 Tax=Kribbella flavida (strain DSM 17836 / JCM 10339 / NBRC 14399) TaxID=479435 RepID=D2PTL8_KRIFD|nr:class F sortase [Kribbella flavida]ADB31331.1 peptidase C60 sortase A and B [Kribbella flavida DSM 17836]
MTTGRRRGRPAPLRRSGLVALTGLLTFGAGAYTHFTHDGGRSNPGDGTSESCLPAAGDAACAGRLPVTHAEVRPSASARMATTPGAARKPARRPPTKAVPARPGRPARIAVAQLGIVAPVVAIRADGGELTPPSDPSTVGWWSGGAQPGAARGSAVITGHTVHDGGGAFDDLDRLRTGAVVTLTTSRGVLRYQVTGVTTYRKRTLAAAAGKLFDQRVGGRLVLVTCEDWNGEAYLSNVVVVARRIA